jgi:hypothetical protein
VHKVILGLLYMHNLRLNVSAKYIVTSGI